MEKYRFGTVQCAIPHLRAVLNWRCRFIQFREEKIRIFSVEEEDPFLPDSEIWKEVYSKCYQNNQMPSVVGGGMVK